jgi:hypothetical protein
MSLPDWPNAGEPEPAVAATESTAPVKKEKKPKTARGFKGLKGVTVGGVIADAVNQVTVLAKDGKTYFVIEAEVVNGLPVMKCTKHKVVRYKRPDTRVQIKKPAINKFG